MTHFVGIKQAANVHIVILKDFRVNNSTLFGSVI